MRHARVAKNPILDLRLLSVQTLRASVLAGFFYRVAAGAIPFLLPLLLQICFHATPLQSGLITCVSALGALLMKFLAAGMLKRFGFRQLLIVNGILSCAFMAAMAAFTATTPLLVMYFILLMGGFARSLQFTSLNTIAYSDIPNAAIARANGLYTVAQQLSLALGVALAALVLEASQWLRGAVDLGQQDFAAAFMVVAIGGLLAIPSFYKLKPTAGDAVSGHVAGA